MIYRLRIIKYDGNRCWSRGRSPRFKVCQSDEYLFLNKDEALTAIRDFEELYPGERKDVYRFVLEELPSGERLTGCKAEWVFDPEGNLIDRTLCSSCHDDFNTAAGQFHGRTPAQIRFRAGDLVEWYDGGDTVHLGIVTGSPFSTERCAQIMEHIIHDPRFASLENPAEAYILDYSDDCYTVIDSPDYMASHEHVPAHYVSAPTFPIAKKLKDRFEEIYRQFLSNPDS